MSEQQHDKTMAHLSLGEIFKTLGGSIRWLRADV